MIQSAGLDNSDMFSRAQTIIENAIDNSNNDQIKEVRCSQLQELSIYGFVSKTKIGILACLQLAIVIP